jgi:hypothetical protein
MPGAGHVSADEGIAWPLLAYLLNTNRVL